MSSPLHLVLCTSERDSSRLEVVTKKLNHLQQVLALDQLEAGQVHHSNAQKDIITHSTSSTIGSSEAEPLETFEAERPLGSTSCFGLENLCGEFSGVESRQLGERIVTGEVIGELFLQFVAPIQMKFLPSNTL